MAKRLPGWVEDMFEGVLPPDHDLLPPEIEPFDFEDWQDGINLPA